MSEKATYLYRIILATQIGNKQGKLLLYVSENKIDGVMDILDRPQSCTGECSPDGKCTITGQIKTLRSVFDYTAIGFLNKNSIFLELKYQHGVFYLTGQQIEEISSL